MICIDCGNNDARDVEEYCHRCGIEPVCFECLTDEWCKSCTMEERGAPLEWEEHPLSGHSISGDYGTYDESGKWYLSKQKDYEGYVTIAGPFEAEALAKAAADELENAK